MTEQDETIINCWNKKGVWRQHDSEVCSELEELRHCHHCDVFINAGLNLLDRALPENYLEDNAQIYHKAKQKLDDSLISCLFFRLKSEWYALKTLLLQEVIQLCDIHPLPHNHNKLISGIVNVRGEIEICISLEQIISGNIISSNESNVKKRMIVIQLQSGKYVFPADEVMGVFTIKQDDIQKTSDSISGTKKQVCSGIYAYKDKHIGLLDESLLNHHFLEIMQ
ncbi:MAG: chemotaxis protein CheW [Gammaproteobacteria bacterium]|nr:chemotaxis protein CheW [Gammaproteobacteria bacterium]